jgi:hypothetical protein
MYGRDGSGGWTFEGDPGSPRSLHKYLLTYNDPVDTSDPSGHFGLADIAIANSLQSILVNIQSTIGFAIIDQLQHGGNAGLVDLAVGALFTIGAIVIGPAMSRLNAEASTRIAENPTEGFAIYGELDKYGRPTGARARITREMIGTGSSASAAIIPPGFASEDGFARGHLIGRQLGGSGTDARNLVALKQIPANSPVMRGFENEVRAAVERGETVDYAVLPQYSGSEPIARGVTLQAISDAGLILYVTVLNQ